LLISCEGRKIRGSIVGTSHAVGHRVRGSFPAPRRTIETGIAILGGGIAGLSAAWKLRRSGRNDFLLFELEPEVGGNSRWGQNEVTAYPWGAHYVPLPGEDAVDVRELFKELGVDVERDVCHAPQERLFAFGRWQEGLYPSVGATKRDWDELARFRNLMNEYRKMRTFRIPTALSDDRMAELDRHSMKEFLDREGFSSERLRWFVEYAMRDDYGCTLETASAWAGAHYFASRDRENEEVLTWPEGNGWIARRLAEPIADRIRTGALVTDVREAAGGVEATVWDVGAEECVRVRSKQAIFALPRFVARHVLREYRERPPQWLGEFTYAPWMTANLTVDRVPEEAAWDNVIYKSPSLGYVVATHQSLARAAGPTVLTYYRPMADRQGMLERTWGSWVEAILADLRGPHPDLGLSRCDVMLFGHAMIRPTPGFMFGRARREAAARLGPIVFAHSDMSGLSLFEEALDRGVRAAEAALDG
jgi:predicted NAD/FAD-binding protein